MSTNRKKALMLPVLISGLMEISMQTSYAQIVDVYIDPGHGGSQEGCTTVIPGFYEKDVNLLVCTLAVKTWFDNYPGMFSAMYSRLKDTTKYNIDRANQADSANALG